MVKHEPEIRRAKAKLYVESQNRKVHEAPWTTGRFNGVGAGGLYEALELGQLAYKAHKLPYEEGLSKMKEYLRSALGGSTTRLAALMIA